MTSSLLPHTLSVQDVHVHLRSAQPKLVSPDRKEQLLAQGVSYGELLSPEEIPSPWQNSSYTQTLERNGPQLGVWLAQLLAQILVRHQQPVLVSLARAGTPVGCALRRLARYWGHQIPHHTLSIIRGVGIDQVALSAIQKAHPQGDLIFVDGWTGKGSIYTTLCQSLPSHIPARLAVLSDPAGVAQFAATYHDALLPHALLNATVCGLLSRTFYTEPHMLHASYVQEDLRPHDLTESYIKALIHHAPLVAPPLQPLPAQRPQPAPQVLALAAELGITDPNLVKPSVGEATRVFLRRAPAGLMLQQAEHPDTLHLLQQAEARGVPVYVRPDLPYLAVALIADTTKPEGKGVSA